VFLSTLCSKSVLINIMMGAGEWCADGGDKWEKRKTRGRRSGESEEREEGRQRVTNRTDVLGIV